MVFKFCARTHWFLKRTYTRTHLATWIELSGHKILLVLMTLTLTSKWKFPNLLLLYCLVSSAIFYLLLLHMTITVYLLVFNLLFCFSRPDLKTLLSTLVSNVCIEDTPSSNMINVCRQNVMDGAVRAFARRTFTPEAKLSVLFMDDFNQAEGAVDEGGPKREFFRLLIMALKESSLFTGPQNTKNLSLDSRG